MAKFSLNGGLGQLINGEKAPLGGDIKDMFQFRAAANGGGGGGGGKRFVVNPVGLQRKGVRALGFGSVRSMGKKSATFSSEPRLDEGGGDGEEEEDDELSGFRGLVLDISYRPVNVVCWKRAICLEFMEKADVLEYYDQAVPSSQGFFYIPAVLRVPHLLQVVKRRRIKYNLTRKSIFYRDNYTCQYCLSRENLTVDHVLPISRGGEWKWDNLVTACSRCNSRKGQKTLDDTDMRLIKAPKVPRDYDILAIPLTAAAVRMLNRRKGVPEEWLQYLSKPSKLP